MLRGLIDAGVLFLVPFVAYTALMIMTPLNIGVRYYLPAYLFLIILSGGLLDDLFRSDPSRRLFRFSGAAAAVTLSRDGSMNLPVLFLTMP